MHEYLQKEEFANCVIREWNLKNTMFVIVVFFLTSEGDTLVFFSKALAHYTMRNNS